MTLTNPPKKPYQSGKVLFPSKKERLAACEILKHFKIFDAELRMLAYDPDLVVKNKIDSEHCNLFVKSLPETMEQVQL